MKLALTLGILLFLPLAMMAQFSYKPGYIINNSGDTTKGFIKENEEAKFYISVSFANSESGGGEKLLSVADIKGFGFSNGNVYQKVHYNTIEGKGADLFAHLLVAGYYNLFTFQVNSREFYLIKSKEDSTYLLYDDELTTMGFLETQGNYKNQLLFLSVSCGTLRERLTSIQYSTGDMISYIQAINKCKAPNSYSQVLYKKPSSFLKIYAYAGGIVLGTDESEITARLMARIIVPTLNRNTSINFGINYMSFSELEKETPSYDFPYSATSVHKIRMTEMPFSVQYNILKGIVQPYVTGGLSLVYEQETGGFDGGGYYARPANKFGVGIMAAVGVECPITHSLYIKADWTYELIMHHPVIGIAYFIK